MAAASGAGSKAFDPTALKSYEWGIVGGAFVALIGLFLPSFSVSYGGVSASVSGWHWAGLWLPVLLLFAAAGLVALRALRPAVLPPLPVGTRVIVAGAAIVALVIEVLRALTFPSLDGLAFAGAPHVSAHASAGTYVITIASAVALAFAVLDLRSSGEQIPGRPHKTG